MIYDRPLGFRPRSVIQTFTKTQALSLKCAFFVLVDFELSHNCNTSFETVTPLISNLELFYNPKDQLKTAGVQNSAIKILNTVNTVVFLRNKKNYSGIESSDVRQLAQYLKKFKFFFMKDLLGHYPNDMRFLSSKDINDLALQALFLLNGI